MNASQENPRRVVITGLGIASPLGCSIDQFWNGLLAGKTGVRIVEGMDLSNTNIKIGAQVTGFNSEDHFSRKELRRLSHSSQMAMIAAQEALQDAGLNPEEPDYDPRRFGVILGSSINGYTAVEPHFRKLFETNTGSPFIIPLVMNNAPASNLSIRYGFHGPLLTTDAACASSAHAIGYAFLQIRNGTMDIALTGGADAALSPAVIRAWEVMRVLSKFNDPPSSAVRPFSKDRDGLILGDGAGILVVESEESALRRGAQIYAEVTGYAATSDGYHLTQPSTEGQVEALRQAISTAGLQPGQIDYINAHATATAWNDSTETAVIKEALGDHAYEIPVVGIKGAIGHPIGASGAMEFVSVALSLRHQVVPPTINRLVPDPECDLDYVTEGQRACQIEHAASNSFAFGGSNAVLVASRYQEA